MNSELHQSKLALAQSLIKGIVVQNVRITHSLLKPVDPLCLVLNFLEENQARLVRRNDQLYRVEVLGF